MADYKLTLLEKETIILWNQAENTVTIETFDVNLINKLNRAKAKAPNLFRVDQPDKHGAVYAEVPKEYFRITVATPLSEETREKLSQLAKERFHK